MKYYRGHISGPVDSPKVAIVGEEANILTKVTASVNNDCFKRILDRWVTGNIEISRKLGWELIQASAADIPVIESRSWTIAESRVGEDAMKQGFLNAYNSAFNAEARSFEEAMNRFATMLVTDRLAASRFFKQCEIYQGISMPKCEQYANADILLTDGENVYDANGNIVDPRELYKKAKQMSECLRYSKDCKCSRFKDKPSYVFVGADGKPVAVMVGPTNLPIYISVSYSLPRTRSDRMAHICWKDNKPTFSPACWQARLVLNGALTVMHAVVRNPRTGQMRSLGLQYRTTSRTVTLLKMESTRGRRTTVSSGFKVDLSAALGGLAKTPAAAPAKPAQPKPSFGFKRLGEGTSLF